MANKTKSMVKLTVDAHMQQFSDGTHLSYECNNSKKNKPQLYVSDDVLLENGVTKATMDDYFRPLDKTHKDVVFSKRPITLRLRADFIDKSVKIDAPVTVGKVMTAMYKFFSRKLTTKDYEQIDYPGPWNVRKFPTLAHLKKEIKTVGNLRGDHMGYAGLVKVRGTKNSYEPTWYS